MNYIRYTVCTFLTALFLFLLYRDIPAQGPPETPPAPVVVSKVRPGVIAPQSRFTGTVYYAEVSEVSAEVRGLVKEVSFEEGQRVRKGEVLARLDTELLEKRIESLRAAYEEVLTEVQKAQRDLERIEGLYREGFASDQDYDDVRFRALSLEKKAKSTDAQLRGLEVELEKTLIKAPFEGLILERQVDRGEWIEAGGVVAVLARDDVVDLVVDVPEKVVSLLKEGMRVEFRAGSRTLAARIFAIVPRGDVSTRTFPVKIRAENTASLREGMEASVMLPVGGKKEALIVSRDALIEVYGKTAVYAVVDGKAKLIPVKVVGYSARSAGVLSQGLREGMSVVVKGNERLKDGQPVKVVEPAG